MSQEIKIVKGIDLKVGDVVFMGGEDRTITGFKDHPGLVIDRVHLARIASAGEFGMTVFHDESFRDLAGVLVPTHLWVWQKAKRGL